MESDKNKTVDRCEKFYITTELYCKESNEPTLCRDIMKGLIENCKEWVNKKKVPLLFLSFLLFIEPLFGFFELTN